MHSTNTPSNIFTPTGTPVGMPTPSPKAEEFTLEQLLNAKYFGRPAYSPCDPLLPAYCTNVSGLCYTCQSCIDVRRH